MKLSNNLINNEEFISNTHKSNLIEENLEIFYELAKNMKRNSIFRYLFLTGLEELSRGETIPISETPVRKVLDSYKIDGSKIGIITKKISNELSGVISQKRAVGIKAGNIGIISPFDENKMALENVSPSVNHIYTSYFSNFDSIVKNISKSLNVPITHKKVDKLFRNISDKIAKITEILYICPICNKFSNFRFRCSHRKYTLRLYKINDAILFRTFYITSLISLII